MLLSNWDLTVKALIFYLVFVFVFVVCFLVIIEPSSKLAKITEIGANMF